MSVTGFKDREIRILSHLYKQAGEVEKPPYLSQIARDIGVPRQSTLRNLRELEEKKMVSSKIAVIEKIGPVRTYELTERGKAFAWAFRNPDELVASFKEETIEERGVRVEAQIKTFDLIKLYPRGAGSL